MKVIVPHLPSRFDQAMQMRVPSIDVNPAKEWGALAVLVGPDKIVSSHTLQQSITDVQASLGADMKKTDYILCVGDMALTATVIAHALKTFGRARLLRWDKKSAKYTVVEVEA